MSFLNGLSQAGAVISQYAGAVGLQAQKADLQNQSLQLADQLQGARESAGRDQAAGIAAAAQSTQNAFTGGQNDLQRASTEGIAAGNNATSRAIGAASNATSLQINQNNINADTPEMKLLRALGGLPAAAGAAPQGGPSASSAPANGTPALSSDGLVTDDAPTSSPSVINGSTPALTVGGSSNPQQNSPMLNKVLGLPQPGTTAALEMGVAHDVAADPLFKNLSLGQQALETAKRIAISAGKITDPALRTTMAQGIANYQIAPLTGMALQKAGGPETMAEVMQINPDYQAARFPTVAKTLESFTDGPQGNTVRSLNVGVQHLSVLDQAADALSNNNTQALNSLKNKIYTQFGYSETPNFDALKQIVGTEVEKAVAGGIGAVSDRNNIMQALNSANSPAQLKAVTDSFRSLMVGQLNGLKTQYEDGTGIKAGPFSFENKLDPETKSVLSSRRGGSSDATPSAPAVHIRADPMAAAKAAIAAGAPRAAVMARLKANGIDPSGLDDASVSSALPSAGQD